MGRRALEMCGNRYGRLVVVRQGVRKSGRTACVCKCDCGNETIVCSVSLVGKHTMSCGCLRKERVAKLRKRKYAVHRAVLGKRLWCSYKTTLAQYDAMVCGQNGKCAVCRRNFSPSLVPNVDHCHNTGRVRGLLCTPCNFVLGYVETSPLWFDSFAVALKTGGLANAPS